MNMASARKGEPVATPDGYHSHADEISLVMGRFFLRYLNALYREFDGDLLLPIVLGEIGHHNVCRFYTANPKREASPIPDWSKATSWKKLEPCNAFSLSAATGIPRETVRRKIDALVRRRWVRRNRRGEVFIRPAASAHFQPGFNVWLLDALMKVSGELRSLLDRGGRPTRPAGPARRGNRSQRMRTKAKARQETP